MKPMSEWRPRAACVDVPTSIFYSHSEITTSGNNVVEMRVNALRVKDAYCNKCRVKSECLEFAMETNERYGIWGGLTERERQTLRRQRQRAARGL